MMSYDFETITHGKWILAGEHAVIRQHGALVFPLLEKQLILQYRYSTIEVTTKTEGAQDHFISDLLFKALKRGQALLHRQDERLTGHFHLKSTIPIGSGLGASAALCVALARWFEWSYGLNCSLFEFATQLEHLFHGQSSGLDIAGAMASSGLYFKAGHCTPIRQHWEPIWRLSASSHRGITAECIQQVQTLWKTNPTRAENIDQLMVESVTEAQAALENASSNALPALATAINKAETCFEQWGLINDDLRTHIQELRSAGALAAKPTGSGGGGYVISLWNDVSKYPF